MGRSDERIPSISVSRRVVGIALFFLFLFLVLPAASGITGGDTDTPAAAPVSPDGPVVRPVETGTAVTTSPSAARHSQAYPGPGVPEPHHPCPDRQERCRQAEGDNPGILVPPYRCDRDNRSYCNPVSPDPARCRGVSGGGKHPRQKEGGPQPLLKHRYQKTFHSRNPGILLSRQLSSRCL